MATPPQAYRHAILAWLISLIIVLNLPLSSNAASVHATWNPSIGATSYTLSYGLISGQYTTELDTGEATSALVAGLTEGNTYYFAVTASNNAGESPYSAEVSVVIGISDTIKPMVALSSPSPGATVPRKGMVAVKANASDNVGVVAVTVYVNGQALCTDQTAPYQCMWTVPAPPNRSYDLHATAIDAAGNMGLSEIVRVTSR